MKNPFKLHIVQYNDKFAVRKLELQPYSLIFRYKYFDKTMPYGWHLEKDINTKCLVDTIHEAKNILSKLKFSFECSAKTSYQKPVIKVL